MKTGQLILGLVLIGLPAAGAVAQTKMQDGNKAAAAAEKASAVHKASGVVKRVDAAKNTVTVAHEPVRSLGWPAMTMEFRVREKEKLAALKPGQRIEFELVEEKKGSYIISRIE
jgi:Cu(I)/Ag(I) efflux system membrane fusion protein